jgi:hypothetical protein
MLSFGAGGCFLFFKFKLDVEVPGGSRNERAA